jgi:hypothetical protein
MAVVFLQRIQNYKKNGTITVRLSNLTRDTITIPQKTIICEVQPVTIETQSTPNSVEDIKLLEEGDITKSALNKEQLDIGKDLITECKKAGCCQGGVL